MRMLRLHSYGTPVLVNPAQIQTVFPHDVEAAGSYIYLAGEDDAVHVDESLDTIDRLVSLG